MELDCIQKAATVFLLQHPDNFIREDDAMRESLVGLRLYDAPIFAVAAADDALFASLRRPEAIHPDYPLPEDWLKGAKSVISFFVPFTERVKADNAVDMRFPADAWLHARFEGDLLLRALCAYLASLLSESGHQAVAPVIDPRYGMLAAFTPKWSERHAAYIAGLGTFSLSKGLITEKGVAGRLGSVVTDLWLPPTKRAYDGLYDYCIRCGRCAAHCPVKAIDPARGMHAAKHHPPCSAFLDHTKTAPPRGKSGRKRYGCGKCQVGVPCQDGIPAVGIHCEKNDK